MALNDITIFDDGTYHPGAKRFTVPGQGAVAAIKAGELVFKSLGGATVTRWSSGLAANVLKPSVGTDYIAGLAMTTSTETASADGVVDVMPNLPGMTYLVNVGTAATWDTQTEYDALVGDRIKLAYAATTGAITALATDWTYNGAIVEPLDIAKHPGKVRFSLRQALNYFA